MSVDDRNWRAEALRATVFYPAGQSMPDVEHLWRVATGRSPENVQTRPRDGTTLAEGGNGNNTLTFSSRPGRVDLNMQPILPDLGAPLEGFVTLGLFLETLPQLQTVVEKWLEESDIIIRLAFGTVLLMDSESVQAANRKVDGMLPGVEVDAEGSSDFFYQINRRRKARSAAGMLVNRLTKWSVLQGNSIDVVASGNANNLVSRRREFFACRLELDINTVGPPNSGIPKAKTRAVFNELIELGKEIAAKGDIA